MIRKRAWLGFGGLLGLMAVAAACSTSSDPPTVTTEDPNTTSPTLADGAPNPKFDPATVPPLLADGAPNPIFDANLPDGFVIDTGLGADARADGGRDATVPPVDAGRDASVPPVDSGTPGSPGVIANAGIAAWDALSATEKARVSSGFASAFLHQSVGQDLEDGIDANGINPEFMTSGSTLSRNGFHGGLFSTPNGNGPGKANEWSAFATRNGSARLRVAIMKFGYAEISGNLTGVQNAYVTAVNAVKAAGIRVVHVTPPLVYNSATDNAPKMTMRTWMLATFPNDVTFDLMDVESTEPVGGARCTRGGSWEICNSVRSTSGCPSVGQGVDAPSGQGHLCGTQARRISKAFLYAIYQAGK